VKRIFFLSILAFCLSAGLSYAQNRLGSKALYCEFFGASQMVGVNYESRFDKAKSDGLGWRIGCGVGFAYSSSGLCVSYDGREVNTYNRMARMAVPLELNCLIGQNKSKAEFGLGAFFCADYYYEDSVGNTCFGVGLAPYVSLGYRLVTERGFLFRIGTLGFRTIEETLGLYPFIGFGKSF